MIWSLQQEAQKHFVIECQCIQQMRSLSGFKNKKTLFHNNFSTMPDNEDDESWQLIQELRDTINELRSDKEDLQERIDDLQRDVDFEKSENEELQERIDKLEEWNESLAQRFNEAFEYYNTIWLDETKDQKLITRMKEIYAEFK